MNACYPDISKDERLEANRRSWMSLDIPSYRTDFRIPAKLTDISVGILISLRGVHRQGVFHLLDLEEEVETGSSLRSAKIRCACVIARWLAHSSNIVMVKPFNYRKLRNRHSVQVAGCETSSSSSIEP